MSPVRRLTSLARPLDPGWPTNRAVLFLMPLGGLAFALLDDSHGWVPRAGAALVGAGTVLGGWALGRELDPDRQGAAFVAMALAVTAALVEPTARLVVLFALLVLVRTVNRTVGPPATLPDLVAGLALAGVSAVALGAPEIMLGAALAFGADAALGGPGRSRWAAVVALGVTGLLAAGGSLIGVGPWRWGAPSPGGLGVTAVVAVGFVAALLRTGSVESVSDLTGEPLQARRIRWGMAVALAVAVATLLHGDPGIRQGVLVWATLAGVALWRGLDGLTAGGGGRRRDG
ncbi:MAG: hypothetical protein P8188_10340 [Gemmatimonadota bacterium]